VEWQTGKYLLDWRNRKAASITKPDILDLRERLEKEHGPYVANRIAVQFLRAVFNWASANEHWDRANPTLGIKLFHEVKRSRFLQRDELPVFFAELKKEKNDDLRDFVQLGIYTGARRSDILSMKWEDVYLDRRIETCEWRVPEPKNETPYVVILTVEAVAILLQRKKRQQRDSPWVFPSYSKSGHVMDLKKAWAAFLKRTGLSDLRIHDLRRTHGSWQASGGSSLPIIGKSLGHRSLVATEIYSRVDLEAVRGSVTDAVRAISQAAKKKPKLLTTGDAA
jgi:integrase